MSGSDGGPMLVLLETSSNQAYVFSTNKLRENLGASDLIWRMGVANPLRVAAVLNGRPVPDIYSPDHVAAYLGHAENVVPASRERPIEIVGVTSGKALAIAFNEGSARKFVWEVTLAALVEAPGLDLRAVFVPAPQRTAPAADFGKAVRSAFAQLAASRGTLPGPEIRFRTMPFFRRCASSGLPAEAMGGPQGDRDWRSAASLAKASREALRRARLRFRMTLEPQGNVDPARYVHEVEAASEEDDQTDAALAKLKWLAIVHADGNGLGQVFLNFADRISGDASAYIDEYRRFSIALDLAARDAVRSAMATSGLPVSDAGQIGLMPVVLGGDDLTAILDGRFAVDFTIAFLKDFEKQTRTSQELGGILPDVTARHFGRPGLSAAAGVAIVKPHFPFHLAYELAEELCASAKTAKSRVCVTDPATGIASPAMASALDFQVVYDSAGRALASIRREWEQDQISLHARPYVVTCAEDLASQGVGKEGLKWASAHGISGLADAREVLAARIEKTGRRRLPNGQIRRLRESLFLGHRLADAELSAIHDRYGGDETWKGLVPDGEKSLFHDDGSRRISRLIDAIDANELQPPPGVLLKTGALTDGK